MNRKLMCALLASVATLFAGGAMAADLPSEAPAPAPYLAPPPPVFTWTGFYVGVNAGVSFNGSDNVFFHPNLGGANDIGGTNSLNPSSNSTAGFTGGGQIGYNWQVSQFVFGVEGDLDYLNRKNLNGTYGTPAGDATYSSYTLSGGNNNQLFGTVRGRVGWAVDRALFYVTGGVAFGGNSAPQTLHFAGGTTYSASSSSASNVGGVVGAGIEYAFTPNWTAKVEYLHTFFNNKNLVYVNNATPADSFSTSGYNFDTNIVRVGLNYKF